MKKQILVASLLCALTTTEHYAKHQENSYKNVTSCVTIVDVPTMLKDEQKRYGETIEKLREGESISRSDIMSLLENDPYLVKDDAGDHAQYRHLYFPIRFGVIDHGTTALYVRLVVACTI